MTVPLRPIEAAENDEVYQMFQEIPAEEDGFENPAFGLNREEFARFCQKEVDYSVGKNLAPGHVPATYFLLFTDDKPTGVFKMRHYLNEYLRQNGGQLEKIEPTANSWNECFYWIKL